LEDWLAEKNFSLDDAYFYSDSINDLPLLEQVPHPIVVDPDPKLNAVAVERKWKVMSLR
jgi:phosphoserine phosphatase